MGLAEQFAEFEQAFPYRETVVGGIRWRYRVGGRTDRPIVLVLTGATMVPDPLFRVVDALGRDYGVIAPAYPPVDMAGLVAGVLAALDAEQATTCHVVGSSFGGYVAQRLVRTSPERVQSLALAQSGVRHFAGPGAMAAMRGVLRLAPEQAVRAFTWRTWRVLLEDIGPESGFWMALLRDILDHQLSKAHLVAAVSVIAEFTGRLRPVPGDLREWERPVLVLAAEHDRAFATQAREIRSVYPDARVRVLEGAGHGAVFTHTDAYVAELRAFLADVAAR